MTEIPDQISAAPQRPRKAGKSVRAAEDAAAGKRRVIVVLGMHRSGTSVVTRGLQALGIELGDNLMKPVEGNNNKGFFEDLDLYRQNERLLSLSKSAWHFLGPLNDASLTGADFSAERRAAAATLSAKLSDSGVFAFKDPRTAILMPFWRCVFEDLELDDRYIIVVRHPLESAASLESRDKIHLTKGVTLWAKHTIEAIRQSAGKPRVFVRFDRVLKAPEAELKRIAATLNLPAAAPNAEAMTAFADEFLSPELRHHTIGRNELRRSGAAPDFAIELYETLLDLVDKDPEGAAIDPDFWRSIETRYEQSAPLLRHADSLDNALRDAHQRLSAQEKRALAAEAELVERTKAVEEAANRASQAKAETDAIKQNLAATAAQLAEAKVTAEKLTLEFAEANRRADAASNALQTQLAEANSAIQSGQARVATLEQALANSDDEARRLMQELLSARQALDAAAAEAAQNAQAAAQLRDAAQRAFDQETAQLRDALDAQRQAAEKAQEALLIDLESVRAQAAIDAALSAELEQQLSEAARKVSDQEIEQLRDALEAQRQAAAKAQATLQSDLEAARTQAASDTALNAELEQRLREAAQRVSEQEITQLKEALDAQRQAAATAQEALQADLKAVRTQAAKDAAINAELEARLREAVERVGNQNAATLQEAIDNLVAASEAAREQAATESTRLHAQLADAVPKRERCAIAWPKPSNPSPKRGWITAPHRASLMRCMQRMRSLSAIAAASGATCFWRALRSRRRGRRSPGASPPRSAPAGALCATRLPALAPWRPAPRALPGAAFRCHLSNAEKLRIACSPLRQRCSHGRAIGASACQCARQ
ncbi:MAG TPA: hypothetical protein PKY87_04295 [Terricaulis sp.]|nr:hypothetical protein [Terricaulis sp.]